MPDLDGTLRPPEGEPAEDVNAEAEQEYGDDRLDQAAVASAVEAYNQQVRPTESTYPTGDRHPDDLRPVNVAEARVRDARYRRRPDLRYVDRRGRQRGRHPADKSNVVDETP